MKVAERLEQTVSNMCLEVNESKVHEVDEQRSKKMEMTSDKGQKLISRTPKINIYTIQYYTDSDFH